MGTERPHLKPYHFKPGQSGNPGGRPSRSSSDRAAGTIRMYAERGGHVLRLLGEVDVNALSFDQVQDYVNRRLEEGAHKETVRKELCVLRKALKLGHARQLRRLDPRPCFPEFKRDYTPRDRYLTEAEFQALLPKLPPKRRLWVQVAVFSGLRLSALKPALERLQLCAARAKGAI